MAALVDAKAKPLSIKVECDTKGLRLDLTKIAVEFERKLIAAVKLAKKQTASR